MFTLQPIKLWRYLSPNKLVVPPNLRRLFYASWEDALWDLLQFFCIPKKSICVVPEFFCPDVVKHMEQHGLRCVFYPVDEQLQTNAKQFAQLLKHHQPRVVVILHAVGITNQLFSQSAVWLKHLPNECLLIEDCVHRLVDPQQLKLLTNRHIVIDSLRKVAPLYGSNLYGDATTLSLFNQTSFWLTLPYQLKIFWWWWLFQVCLHLVAIPWSKSWSEWWSKQAFEAMMKGYDLIGSSKQSAQGLWLFKILAEYISVNKIEQIKVNQVMLYSHLLSQCWQYADIYQINYSPTDTGLLRGYPIGIKLGKPKKLFRLLQQSELNWQILLEDSPWSKRQKIIYLPLGPHLNNADINNICQLFITTLNNSNSVVS